MHLLLLISLFTISFSWLHVVGILVMWVLIGGYGVAVGYHRYFAHKSFKTYRWVEVAMAFLGLLSCDGSLPFWVALHRGLHHRFADTEKDPHSPRHGILESFILWQRNISEDTVSLISARDVMRDEVVVFLHDHQYQIFWLVFGLLFMISPAFALGVFVPASLLSHHQDNLVNVMGHIKWFGSYRNHETDDQSVNDVLTGLLVFGQGWHNNHHHNAGKSNFGGERWWEFDTAHHLLIPLIRKK